MLVDAPNAGEIPSCAGSYAVWTINTSQIA
jgi:hypothetical protein